ncbi:ATP-binding cassette subfamily B protein AbcA/BmrA [Bacillus ectoiniformans]|uniref:ABC transporter ATP-binding protein n=1 Tax=Bacillus ectoiniformans TaxID=1494429 RepID=UPI00195BFDDF|nr:ABC transporter ATP-binding protein [Bacillus ectoiniformans]MBM7647383.1 ATP-binding cassette subfamily B protein AbcA/BmrA [Bacillus ectoiniformans]
MKRDESKASRSSLRSLWAFLQSIHWPRKLVIIALILALAETFFKLAVPLFTMRLVDGLTGETFQWQGIAILITVFLLQGISGGFSYYLLSKIGETIVKQLRNRLWGHVLRLPVSYFDSHETGQTMSRITQDTGALKNLITGHLINVITGIISIIGSIAFLLVLDWKMTLIMLTSVPVMLLIIRPLGAMMYKISRRTQDETSNFSGLLGRTLSEIRLVKSFHAENKEEVKGNNGIDSLYTLGLKEAKILSIISPVMTFIIMAVLVVILGYGGVRVSEGALSAGTLVAIIFYLFQIIVPFTQMASSFTAFQKAAGATERIQEIIKMSLEPLDQGGLKEWSNDPLHFNRVSFSYSKEQHIIKDVSFTIPPGKTTAITGPSGGGKTTLFALIEQFYQPDAGEILLGERPAEAFDLAFWRKSIGYVSQESPLLSGTIYENICYGLDESVPMERVVEAAVLANAHPFIEDLADGYQTEIGERGMKLSGGQRQRIAIARALIADPELLLLDEATSSLDAASENLIQEALIKLMEGRTSVVIAHRLSTVLHADQIIFFENGEVTGTGTHEELYDQHAMYRDLVNSQGLQKANS